MNTAVDVAPGVGFAVARTSNKKVKLGKEDQYSGWERSEREREDTERV